MERFLTSDSMSVEEMHEMRSRIAKRSSAKGGEYERVVAKKICHFFGLNPKEWEKMWLKTKRTKGGQPHGDLKPLRPISDYWDEAGLGPIEAKNRKEWSLMELFKNPIGSKLYGYWIKSNKDTDSKNSIVCFTKPYAPNLVFYNEENPDYSVSMIIIIEGKTFVVCRLEHFLSYYFPSFGPKD
jgi:hypothetical protein